MGYMAAIPETDKRSRWDQAVTGLGKAPDMPELGTARYLSHLWEECGRASPGLSGAVPLTWAEVDAFGRAYSLETWEVRLIRVMSCAYVAWMVKGRSPFCRRPWDGTEPEED